MLDRIRAWYAAGLWSATKVEAAVERGWITAEDAHEILPDSDPTDG